VRVRLGDILHVNEKRLVIKPPPSASGIAFFIEGRRAYLVFDSAEVVLTLLDDAAIVELVRKVPWDGSTRYISQSVSFLAEELRVVRDVAVVTNGRANLFLVSEVRQRLESLRSRWPPGGKEDRRKTGLA
jgi:hypothetical protein